MSVGSVHDSMGGKTENVRETGDMRNRGDGRQKGNEGNEKDKG